MRRTPKNKFIANQNAEYNILKKGNENSLNMGKIAIAAGFLCSILFVNLSVEQKAHEKCKTENEELKARIDSILLLHPCHKKPK